jgi:hypothetical protein
MVEGSFDAATGRTIFSLSGVGIGTRRNLSCLQKKVLIWKIH